ncbi:sodium:proton antiporter [Cardinium endosymbiont of Tipula unca]|uniref:sodium:proton antiporter n=1 Tax=Cardinium endosymbiont of Tipula unca TaxID=3066216 RepID=UPI003BB2029A
MAPLIAEVGHVKHLVDATALPPLWLAIPFVVLLLMIATGPLFFPHFWHKHYPKIAVFLAAFVVFYYFFFLKNKVKPVEAAAEYIQFMALIIALYVTTGGILIKVHAKATPLANIILLAIGAIAANLIGTTGASMLFIRPYLRLNKHRIKVYHIVFFIFIVSNVGGALTPIGDPPLFLGFIKGVPFGWTLVHNIMPWFVAIVLLLAIFCVFDKKNKASVESENDSQVAEGIVSIKGSKNLLWLAVIIGAVFLDPTVVAWVPTIDYHGHHISFLRELIMLAVALFSFSTADKKILTSNEFNFEPLNEVCLIFIGIFATMMPALELIGAFAQSAYGRQLITPNTLYWGTGFFSSILDNAPTYLNFTAASMAAQGANISLLTDVQAYAAGGVYPHSVMGLRAISLASVFFGAMTYIGNGPNFMVKSIAEQAGVTMPSFGNYIFRFSIPILLPILFVVWLLFFACSS